MLIDISKTERLEHPDEAGQWIEIRPLLAAELDRAREAQIKRILAVWGDTIKDMTGPANRERADDLATRVQQFDAGILLTASIVAWSYEAPVNKENIDKLDGVTRDWLVEEVVKRNTRPWPNRGVPPGARNGEMPARVRLYQ